MPAPCFIRRLCCASQTLFQKLRYRRKSSGPVTDFTMPSCSCPGSRHYSQTSPSTSFQGSWGETPVTDEFLSGTAIGSPIQLGGMRGLTAVNSDPVLSPKDSPNGRVYIGRPEAYGFSSTAVSQTHHNLHMGGLRVVNSHPGIYPSQVTTPTIDTVRSQESFQEQIVIPSARTLISLMPSKEQCRVPTNNKCSYCSANRPNSTSNSSSSIESHVHRSTSSEHFTSISLDYQAPPTTICPPCPVSEAKYGTQALPSAPSNYWQTASSDILTPVPLEIDRSDTTRCPPYPTSEPESVISNLSPPFYPRPLFATSRTSISVRRQTSEMFLIDAHSPNSQQVSQLTDTSKFGRDGIGVTAMSVSGGRLQTIASLEQLVDRETRNWASGSLSPLNMVSNTFPNHRSTWPWREFPGAGSFPLPSGLVAGLNAGQIAQDRRIWRNLFH